MVMHGMNLSPHRKLRIQLVLPLLKFNGDNKPPIGWRLLGGWQRRVVAWRHHG